MKEGGGEGGKKQEVGVSENMKSCNEKVKDEEERQKVGTEEEMR